MSSPLLWEKFRNLLKLWWEVRCQRRALRTLDDHLLQDIGISRIDAEREAERPFWDLAGRKDQSLRERPLPEAFETPRMESVGHSYPLQQGRLRCRL